MNIQDLFDDARRLQTVRDLRWPDGVVCPSCGPASVVMSGRDDTQPDRRRDECRGCRNRFDDLTDTVFAGHHQPLRTWVACLHLTGLNLPGLQVARALGIGKGDARDMITALRQGVVDRAPPERPSGEVECDGAYVVAGHTGHPEAVQKKGGSADDGA